MEFLFMYDPFRELQNRLNNLVNKEITKLLLIAVIKLNILKFNIRAPLEVTIVESNRSYKIEINRYAKRT